MGAERRDHAWHRGLALDRRMRGGGRWTRATAGDADDGRDGGRCLNDAPGSQKRRRQPHLGRGPGSRSSRTRPFPVQRFVSHGGTLTFARAAGKRNVRESPDSAAAPSDLLHNAQESASGVYLGRDVTVFFWQEPVTPLDCPLEGGIFDAEVRGGCRRKGGCSVRSRSQSKRL